MVGRKWPEVEENLPSLEDMELIGPVELAAILGRSHKSVVVDHSRRPEMLPPAFKIPGTGHRKLVWRKCDVARWMNDIARQCQEQADRYAAELAARRRRR